jgi:Holliday junction DNA helicase RuvA
MIHYIKGTLTMKLDDRAVIETGGIGYEIYVPANSELYMAAEGSDVMVFTAMIVKEDDMSLYGFSDEPGLRLFNELITVNGVGAKAAMAILSSMPAEDIRKAIVFEDVSMLTRANGIGKKTAQRIVLDLKDRLGSPDGGYNSGEDAAAALAGDSRAEAVDALISLGYSRSEASAALLGVRDDDLSSEEYIKLALKKI